MKKSLLKLLAVALAASTLSGCSLTDLFGGKDLPEETREFNLSLRDYSSTVIQNTTYKYDGKVYVVYKDDNSEKEVTSLCKYSTVDTSKLGKVDFRVDYETKSYTKYTTTQLTVVEAPVLDSISLSNFSSTVVVGDTYTFDGNVIAHYTGNKADEDVTSFATFDYSEINTSVEGDYSLKVSYKEGNITKEVSETITVYKDVPKISKIEASDYVNTVDKGETYVFGGKVIATYVGGGTADVTNKCTYGNVDTSKGGESTLTISVKDPANNNKVISTTVKITVISHLESISASAISVSTGNSESISISYFPADATNKKIISYISNNTSIATVDGSGNVTGVAVGSTTITVTAEEKYNNNPIACNVSVTVTEKKGDAWTILLYLCGSSLESGSDYGSIYYGGAATSDIEEILSVSNQPDDVNFVIQTGGASEWLSTYGISSSNNQRYHVENKQLVKDNNKVYNNYKGMGDASTLKDFLVWGLETYPAEKVGLILWNHGGGLDGVCYDEKKNNNALTNDEVVTAVSGALTETGLSKLEFIGYDACLMQMMEVAEFNAPYFNYQIASQESEAGSGWDYDTWVDDLYLKKSTENILKAIVDGFIEDNGGVNYQGETYQGQYYAADQTLSYLDLSKISDFKTAWEALATQVQSKITSSNKSTFKSNVVGKTKWFAEKDEYYAEFDCYNFLEKLSSNSTFNPGVNYISDVKTALENLVKYNVVQKKDAGDAHGLSFYFGTPYNSSTYSHFSNWVSLVSNVGGYEYVEQGGGGWYY